MNRKQLALVLICLPWHSAAAEPAQSLQAISDAVGAYIKSGLAVNGKTEVEAGNLDPRLQLPACAGPLQVSPQGGELKAGRNTLAVRCNGGQGWLIYTSAMVRTYKDIVLLRKDLKRGDAIRAEDLTTESRDVGTLSRGYLTDPEDLINKQAARNLTAGSVLNRQSYQAPFLVKRGERVNIQSGNAVISISSAGVAMTDGAKGDRINVKNIGSQRMVQGVVIDSGIVSVNF